jgi:UDP-GlcNAc:undecaprenyl-phosphate GlcNAc-1-phosphate transferase
VIRKIVAMFSPDRGHIHHQLIARGFSHRKVVLLLYVVSALFGVGAFAVTFANTMSMIPILIAIGIATFVGVSQLRYKEMAVLRNGMLLPLYEWPLMNSTVFHGFLDLAFIVGGFLASISMASHGKVPVAFDRELLQVLTVAGVTQLGVFYVCGLYKHPFRRIAMAELLKILKIVTLAVVVTWGVLLLLPVQSQLFNLPTIILDFYVVLSLVLGARISFHVLNYFSQRERHDGKRKVLIYGAGSKGALMAQQILGDNELNLYPVGFLDDDPAMEGKRLNGYPIFGGHWNLPRLLNKTKVDEIVIACDSLKPLILERIISVSRSNGVTIRRSNISLEEVQPTVRTIQAAQGRFAFVPK